MVGYRLSFNGTYSYDPDGYITEFHWYVENTEDTAYYFERTGAMFTWIPCWEGRYLITLVVKDNDGLTGRASREVLVEPLPDNYIHPADILYHPAIYADIATENVCPDSIGIITGHTGLVACDFRVIEALAEGVVKRYTCQEFTNRYAYQPVPEVYVLRVQQTPVSVRRKAVEFALAQIGKPYDWDSIPTWSKQLFGPSYYCSELVWAAYEYGSGAYIAEDGTVYCGYINLDAGDGNSCTGLLVTPNEIYKSPWTYVVRVLYPQ